MFLLRNCCFLQKTHLLYQSRKFVIHTSPKFVNLALFSSPVLYSSKNLHSRTLATSTLYRINASPIVCCKPVENNNAEEMEKKQASKAMKYSYIFLGVVIAGFLVGSIWEVNKPILDDDGNVVKDEYSDMSFLFRTFYRLRQNFFYYKKLVQEPSREKLLPDPLKHPYIQPPYTVVLELTDVLVHPDWTYQTGWRFKKRPGVDQFLEAIAPPQFETVIYTAEQGLTAFPIIDALDRQEYIMYRLVRDATRFIDGHHVKDLDCLNRDLSKVIVIDWNPESVKLNPDNMFKIPRWDGNDNDTTLYDLAAFLKTIHSTKIDDVREVLNYYKQFDNPLETFKENRRKLLMQMEEENKLKEEKPLTSKWRPSFLRN